MAPEEQLQKQLNELEGYFFNVQM